MALDFQGNLDSGFEAVSGPRRYLIKRAGDQSYLVSCHMSTGEAVPFVCHTWAEAVQVCNGVERVAQIGDRIAPGFHEENFPEGDA